MVRDDRRPAADGPAPLPCDHVAPAWAAAGGLLLALIGLTALLPRPTDLLTLSGSGAATVDAAVLAGAALLVWALTAWVAVVLAVALVGVLPGACGRQARRLLAVIAPRLALRLVAVAVGASALAGTTACGAPIFASSTVPATATTTESTATASTQVLDPAGTVTTTPTSAVLIDIDWPSADPSDAVPVESPAPSTTIAAPTSVSTTPANPPAAAAPSSAVAASPTATATAATDAGAGAGERGAPSSAPPPVVRPTGEPIVVRPGDTLWALAAEHLPDGAGDAAVDAAWHQWYALNRDVIGDDPDLLQPGQRLVAPPADPPTNDQENDR